MKMFHLRQMAMVLFVLVGLLLANHPQQNQETYSEVEIYLPQFSDFQTLAAQGLIFDHIKILDKNGKGLHFKTVLNSREQSILAQSGVYFKVLVPDVVQAYRNRQTQTPHTLRMESQNVPAGFEYGSMGGFYTFDEVVQELDSLRLKYPNLISVKQSIGKSIENRDLWFVKISDNPDVDEDEPEVLFTALHHAREPAGMMTLMYFMDYILEKYGSDPQITYLIDHREIFVLPVVNPDGYVYNEQTNPEGGGMWRKNRRPVQSWYGIDLNRNYGYKWGYDDNGSSPYPFSDTYRGSAPFSEPETQAIRDFSSVRQIKCVLNYHSYSDKLIYPWAYINALTDDSLTFMEFANLLTTNNHYNFGNCYQTIGYNANGDADDWFYGEQSEKAKILALTPEVGSDDDGFWPSQERIVPLCKANLQANIFYTWLAGTFPQAESFWLLADDNQNGFAEPGEQITLLCRSKNGGLSDGQNITIHLQSDVSGVQVVDGPKNHAQFAAQSTVEDTFVVNIAQDVAAGTRTLLTLQFQLDGYTHTDTLGYLVIGNPVVVFSDDAENGTGNWYTGQSWGVASTSGNTSNHFFSDSPQGTYTSNADNVLVLKQALQLPAADQIFLTYRAKWDVERAFDWATVEISTDSMNWQTLQTPNMMSATGQGKQSNGTYGYDGYHNAWQWEWIDITSYQSANKVYLRFRLQSDGGENKDGFDIDDIQVLAYNTKPSAIVQQTKVPNVVTLFPPFPNPFNPQTTLRYYLPFNGPVTVTVFDIHGQKITTLLQKTQQAGWHQLQFNGQQLASGLYLIQLKAGNHLQTRKVILLK